MASNALMPDPTQRSGATASRAASGRASAGSRKVKTGSRWIKIGEQTYAVTDQGSTVTPTIPVGQYAISRTTMGLALTAKEPLADQIVELPDCQSDELVAGIEEFWRSDVRARYQRHGILHKRGILAYGPPGTGKTIMVRRMAAAMVERGGLVLFGTDPGTTGDAMAMVRTLQPELPLMVLYEDLEYWADDEDYGPAMTALLDGERQVENVVFVATTNHLEKLSARFVNRPARFDVIVEIGPPTAEARRVYLLHALATAGEAIEPATVESWVAATEGLMVAHLREMVAAVLCLDQAPGLVIERLKKMGS